MEIDGELTGTLPYEFGFSNGKLSVLVPPRIGHGKQIRISLADDAKVGGGLARWEFSSP